METPKEYYYTYYSYEEWGRGYFGARKCHCLPEEDVKYFGTFYDKTFKPTQKIILKGDYKTHQEAIQDEIFLHDYFEVDINPHFANQAKQRSTKFCLTSEKASEYGKKSKELGLGIHALTTEQRRQNSKISGHIGGKKCYENKSGMFKLTREERVELGKRNYESGIGLGSLTKEQRSEAGKKGGKKAGKITKELGTGLFGLTEEQKSEAGKKGGSKTKELGVGIHALTKEERSEHGKKLKELGVGIHGLSKEERSEISRKGIATTNSQRWQCTETGYVSTPAGLSAYQRPRGIDTSKRRRIS